MIEIPLTKGFHPVVAIVDDEDAELVSGYNWCPCGRAGYPAAYVKGEKPIYLHKLITGTLLSGHGIQVDHINMNVLDNRRCNLRVCTNSQNQMHRGKTKRNKSGYKGVYRLNGKWAAMVGLNYKRVYLGTFDTPEEAAQAYNVKARELFGEYALLNDIPNTHTDIS
jgi:hypothetical protein